MTTQELELSLADAQDNSTNTTPQENSTVTTNEIVTEVSTEEDAKRIFIMVTMPLELHDAIVEDAKQQGISKAGMARQLLADKYGIKLEAASARSDTSGMTAEEKEASKKAAAKSRADLIKELKAQHKAAIAAAGKAAAEAAVAAMRAPKEEAAS